MRAINKADKGLGLREVLDSDKGRYMELIVSNANPFAVRYEADFELNGKLTKPSAWLTTRNARKLWSLDVSANSSALYYTEAPQR